MKVAFTTLGCKVNQYDTQIMMHAAQKGGHQVVPFAQIADAYIINSCTVTAESDRKTRQLIGRAKKTAPDAFVCVAGCYAQRKGEALLSQTEVDGILGTGSRLQVLALLEGLEKGKKLNLVRPLAGLSFEQGDGLMEERSRAVVKIQDGCNRSCSYCIIPMVRGGLRSRPVSSIAREVQRAASAGHQEVVLTGIRVMAYHTPEKEDIVDAVLAAAETDIHRIRLGSLDPDEMTASRIKRLSSCAKVCPQFHLSLQSGCDETLLRMNRRYTAAQYFEVVERLRQAFPDASFTTDIMVGFPGETQRDHEASLDFVQKVGFSKLHVFPYSRRAGTRAAQLPGQLSQAQKQSRAQEMHTVGEALARAYAQSRRGRVEEIILEQPKEGGFVGHTRGYAEAVVEGADLMPGKLLYARVTGVENTLLLCHNSIVE